jgi:hypothetical protein
MDISFGKHLYILDEVETATPRWCIVSFLIFNTAIFIGRKKNHFGKEITILSNRRPKGEAGRKFVIFARRHDADTTNAVVMIKQNKQ